MRKNGRRAMPMRVAILMVVGILSMGIIFSYAFEGDSAEAPANDMAAMEAQDAAEAGICYGTVSEADVYGLVAFTAVKDWTSEAEDVQAVRMVLQSRTVNKDGTEGEWTDVSGVNNIELARGTEEAVWTELLSADPAGNAIEYRAREEAALDGFEYSRPGELTSDLDVSGKKKMQANSVTSPVPANWDFSVTKRMLGREWNDSDVYTFTLEPYCPPGSFAKKVEDIPMPSNAENRKLTITLNKDNKTYDDINNEQVLRYDQRIQFSETGEYWYTLKEEPTNVERVSTDPSIRYICVYVYKSSWQNRLFCYASYYEKTTAAEETTRPIYDGRDTTFANEYTEPQAAGFKVDVKKEYDNPSDGKEFYYGLYATSSSLGSVDGIEYPDDIAAPETPGAQIGSNVKMVVGQTTEHDFRITFDKPGIYEFVVKEIIPADNAGVNYDTHETKLTVKVTQKESGDGFEAAVSYNNGGADSAADKAVFKNSAIKNAEAEIKVRKEFSSKIKDWKGWTDETFTFNLTPTEGTGGIRVADSSAEDGIKTVPSLSETVNKDTEAHTAVFDKIIYTEADLGNENEKTFTYKLSETVPEGAVGRIKDGIRYAEDQTIQVKVTKTTDGGLKAEVVYPDNDLSEAVMKNEYSASGEVTANLKATKRYLNSDKTVKTDWDNKTFDFELVPAKGSPVPAGTADGAATRKTATKDNQTVDFGSIKFTQPGEYTYGIKEVLPSNVPDGDVSDGETLYDVEEHSVVVKVSDNGNGGLSEEITITYDTGDSTTGPIFENTEHPEAYTELHASKQLYNASLLEGEFSFGLYNSNENGTLGDRIGVITNDAAGKIKFSKAFTYGELFGGTPTADKSATKYYLIKEIGYNGSDISAVEKKDGFTFDKNSYLYKVVFTYDHSNNSISTKVSYKNASDTSSAFTPIGTNGPTFRNFYGASGETQFKVGKSFSSNTHGFDGWPGNQKIRFSLERVDGKNMRYLSEGKVEGATKIYAEADEAHREAVFDKLVFDLEYGDLYDTSGSGWTRVDTQEIEYKISEVTESNNGIIYKDPEIIRLRLIDNKDGTIGFEYIDDNNTVYSEDEPIEFVNGYEAKGKEIVPIKVSKTIAGRGWNDADTFTFSLEALTPDAPMPAPNTLTISSADEDHSKAFEIEITKPGVWEYRITETAGTSEGLTYDTTAKYVTITAKDDGKGGIKFDEADAIVYNNDDSVTAADKKTNDSAAFTNVYKAKGDATVSVMKEFTSEVEGWKWDEERFYFTLRRTDEKRIRTEVAGGNGRTHEVERLEGAVSSNSKKYTFDKIVFTQDDMKNDQGEPVSEKTFEYILAENVPEGAKNRTKAGITYAADQTVSITVTDDGKGNLNTSVKYEGSDTGDAALMENTYTAVGKVNAVIRARKIYTPKNGTGWGDKQFQLELVPNGNEPVPRSAGSDRITRETVSEDNPEAVFEEITFTEPGVYKYLIREGIPKGVTRENPVDNSTNTLYDPAEHSVTVTVKDDGEGGLQDPVVTYYRGDSSDETNIPVFYNRELPDVFFELYAGKKLTGADLQGGEFSFTLYKQPDGWTPNSEAVTTKENEVRNTTSDSNGHIYFRPISFSRSELFGTGDSNEKVLYYAAAESRIDDADPDSASGFTYDNSKYLYKVTLTAGTGVEINKTVEYLDGQIWKTLNAENKAYPVFNNHYNAVGTASLKVKKEFTCNDPSWSGWGNQTFDFEVVRTDGGKIRVADNQEVEKLTGTATKDAPLVTFSDIVYTVDDLYVDGKRVSGRTMEYKVSEVIPNDTKDGVKDGITYDTKPQTIEVYIHDNGNGTITAVYGGKDGTETMEPLTFVNAYRINRSEEKSASIKVGKTLTGKTWTSGEKFSFSIEAVSANAPMPGLFGRTVTVDAGNKVAAFGPITYTTTGTWRYRITENDTSIKHITKDQSVKYVTVTVSDQGNGTLSEPAVTYDNSESVTEADKNTKDKAAFTNKYEGSETVTIKLGKTLSGRSWKTSDKFSFIIDAVTENAPMPDAAGRTVTVKKGSTETEFGTITYTKPGTWKYKITEKDTSIKGITKDPSTKYVTITVAENEDGTLAAPVAVYDNSSSVTDADKKTTDKAAFTNKYKKDKDDSSDSDKTKKTKKKKKKSDDTKKTKSSSKAVTRVKTGDSASIVLEIVVLASAASILAAMLVRRRKRRE